MSNLKYPVVYSYKLSRTRELELSLKSLKNLKDWNGEVYIIGDKPTLNGNFTHLPIKYDWGKKSGSKSNDEICAYLTASDLLKEFTIMADDIFILRQWSIEAQNRGSLTEHIASRRNKDYYTRSLMDTRQYLLNNGKPELSYELHIPMLVKSDNVKEMGEIVNKSGKALLIRSLIGNWYNISSVRATDPKNQLITEETVLYSSDDHTFKYDLIRERLK